jgi:DNA-binding NtrC family response regulator
LVASGLQPSLSVVLCLGGFEVQAMVAASIDARGGPDPFNLVVNGEAGQYIRALEQIVGRRWLTALPAKSDEEVLRLVRSGVPHGVMLDEAATEVEPLRLLRTIRRENQTLLVVLLTRHSDRHWLQEALGLTAFSVVIKPLRLEELLVQVHRMMVRLDAAIRRGRPLE